MLAARLGVAIERPDMPASGAPTTFTRAPHQLMTAAMRALARSSSVFDQYRARSLYRLAGHLQRLEEVGGAVVDADLDDMAALLGHRPDSWDAGEAELEQFVLADAGAHDAELIDLLHRRNWRHWATIAPPGSTLARWEPVQHRRPERR